MVSMYRNHYYIRKTLFKTINFNAIFATEVVVKLIIHASIYLLQRVGPVTALVQQAVPRVGGDQGASRVCVVN